MGTKPGLRMQPQLWPSRTSPATRPSSVGQGSCRQQAWEEEEETRKGKKEKEQANDLGESGRQTTGQWRRLKVRGQKNFSERDEGRGRGRRRAGVCYPAQPDTSQASAGKCHYRSCRLPPPEFCAFLFFSVLCFYYPSVLNSHTPSQR